MKSRIKPLEEAESHPRKKTYRNSERRRIAHPEEVAVYRTILNIFRMFVFTGYVVSSAYYFR